MNETKGKELKACVPLNWSRPVGMEFELVSVEEGHVFAWQKIPSPQAQVLTCVICGQPRHALLVGKDKTSNIS